MKTRNAPKLVFGDPSSIQYVHSQNANSVVRKFTGKLKCPYCKRKAVHCFDKNFADDQYGWNFDCKPTCWNSREMAEKSGGNPEYEQKLKLYTNGKGEFLKRQPDIEGC